MSDVLNNQIENLKENAAQAAAKMPAQQSTVDQRAIAKMPSKAPVDYFGDIDEGEIDASDYLVPRAKLLQSLSKQVAQDETHKAGDIINSLTSELLTKEVNGVRKLKFIPVLRNVSYFKTAKIDGKQEIEYIAKSRYDERVRNDPDAWKAKTINYFIQVEGQDTPLILAFRSSLYKTAKKLNTLLMAKRRMIFETICELTVVKTTNDQGTFFTLDVACIGDTPKDCLPDLQQQHLSMKEFSKSTSFDEQLANDIKAEENPLEEATEIPF